MKKQTLKSSSSYAALDASKVLYCATGFLVVFTILSAIALSASFVSADTTITVAIDYSCTMRATAGTGGTATTDGYSYTASIMPGNYQEIDGSILTTSCNGDGNYALYAIGFSNDSYTSPTNSQMLYDNAASSPNNINTNTNTSGDISGWSFKLQDAGSASPTVISSYADYANIPQDGFAKVANYIPGVTGTARTSSIQAKYRVYVSPLQTSGAYTGKIKYTMVYPNDKPAPSI